MRASELRDVIYNPIWTSKVLHYFLSGTTISGPPKIKTEMLCLFPLIFNDSMMQLLSRANSASSFYSLFETKRNIDSKLLFIDIIREIVAFREIACEALIYLANQINLSIGEFIEILDVVNYADINDALMQKQCKAAFYWGHVLAKEDCTTLFIKLGILEL